MLFFIKMIILLEIVENLADKLTPTETNDYLDLIKSLLHFRMKDKLFGSCEFVDTNSNFKNI